MVNLQSQGSVSVLIVPSWTWPDPCPGTSQSPSEPRARICCTPKPCHPIFLGLFLFFLCLGCPNLPWWPLTWIGSQTGQMSPLERTIGSFPRPFPRALWAFWRLGLLLWILCLWNLEESSSKIQKCQWNLTRLLQGAIEQLLALSRVWYSVAP